MSCVFFFVEKFNLYLMFLLSLISITKANMTSFHSVYNNYLEFSTKNSEKFKALISLINILRWKSGFRYRLFIIFVSDLYDFVSVFYIEPYIDKRGGSLCLR